MDKGLQEINKLKMKLDDLKLKLEQNDLYLKTLKKENLESNICIDNLQNQLNTFKNLKVDNNLISKKSKKNIIKGFSLLFLCVIIFMTILGLLISLTKGLGVSYFLHFLKTSTVTCFMLCSCGSVLKINLNKNKYKKNRVVDYDSLIQEKEKELEEKQEKQSELCYKINNLEVVKLELEKQIKKVMEQINSIEDIRLKVINDYCKNNKILDNLLDQEYDKFIENKTFKKTKNSNS